MGSGRNPGRTRRASGGRTDRAAAGAAADVAEADVTTPHVRRLRRTWPQRLILTIGVLTTSLSLLTAAGVTFVHSKVAKVQRVSLGLALSAPLPSVGRPVRPSAATDEGATDAEAVNILVVGIDNADGLAADDRRRIDRDDGKRSDTIMLVRLVPSTRLAVALSFPRDLWLPLGGDGGRDRINAALPLGGPELLVRTITANFGVPVDHYVEVDFAQFRRLVDVVGGVPMPFDRPVRDDNSGLYVGEPGCVVLSGDQALDYVRSRYLQVLEGGEWQPDGFADLSRIRRQQDFMRRALRRAQSKGLDNPFTANRLIDVGLDAVTVDDGFAVGDMVSLARRFRSLDAGSLLTFSLPTVPFETAGGAAVLGPLTAEAEPVLDIFRGLDPDSPAAVHASVDDPAVAQALQAKGFTTEAAPAPATRPARTIVRYRPIDRYRAESLARWLGAADLVPDEALATPGVSLEVGADLGGVLDQPRPAPSHWQSPTPAVGVLPGEGRSDICT
jgi:LCP family protein required for cell wall assembly